VGLSFKLEFLFFVGGVVGAAVLHSTFGCCLISDSTIPKHELHSVSAEAAAKNVGETARAVAQEAGHGLKEATQAACNIRESDGAKDRVRSTLQAII
jgi:hypothetical protein